MKFKLFEDFQSQLRTQTRSMDLCILASLERLSPDGGNSALPSVLANVDDWSEKSPLFDSNGPDLFINFSTEDAREFAEEIELVSKLFNSSSRFLVVKEFDEYSLKIEKFTPDEIIVSLKFYDVDKIVNFYENDRERMIKEIKERWRINLTSKRYGLG